MWLAPLPADGAAPLWLLRYAPIASQLTLELKGMYLKNAQMVSTRDEFLPEQYMEFCKRMQDQVPTEFAPGQARRIVESELGKPIDAIFEYFDDEPCVQLHHLWPPPPSLTCSRCDMCNTRMFRGVCVCVSVCVCVCFGGCVCPAWGRRRLVRCTGRACGAVARWWSK